MSTSLPAPARLTITLCQRLSDESVRHAYSELTSAVVLHLEQNDFKSEDAYAPLPHRKQPLLSARRTSPTILSSCAWRSSGPGFDKAAWSCILLCRMALKRILRDCFHLVRELFATRFALILFSAAIS